MPADNVSPSIVDLSTDGHRPISTTHYPIPIAHRGIPSTKLIPPHQRQQRKVSSSHRPCIEVDGSCTRRITHCVNSLIQVRKRPIRTRIVKPVRKSICEQGSGVRRASGGGPHFPVRFGVGVVLSRGTTKSWETMGYQADCIE